MHRPSGPSTPSMPIPQHQSSPSIQPGWAPASGPVSSGHLPAQNPQFFQGNSWGGRPPPRQPVGPTSWNQGGPPQGPKRNPWPIVAAVAVVVVLVIAGIGIWLVVPPDPVKPKKPVTYDRLSALLLTTSDINTIMGASNMKPGNQITSMGNESPTVSPSNCLGALYTNQDAVYAGSGYTGVNALVLAEPGDDNDHFVSEAAVAFPSTEKATAFLQTALTAWKSCAGKIVTSTNKSSTSTWTFAYVDGAPPRVTITDTQEKENGWMCERAMSVENNVIVDVNACGFKITDQAGQIDDRIVAKVVKESG
jgi:serine/threonine kinase PknH